MADETNRVVVFDTTLRDGEQTPGCALGTRKKVAVAEQLVRLGVDVIEAGFPAASAGEAAAVQAVASAVARLAAHHSPPTVAALARANRRDIQIVAEALAPAPRRRIHTFIATSDLHLERKLRLTRSQGLGRAVDAVRFAREFTSDVEFSAEDASRSDRAYLLDVLRAACEAGASTINVPDTVGWASPAEYAQLIAAARQVADEFPGVIVSAHCHDDLGLAVANTLAAVAAGARQVEVTINGLGERAGNAALEEVVMALAMRGCFMGSTRLRTGELARTSRLVSELTGIAVPPNKAIVGANAFAHESGIHQQGMMADRRTYEIMSPELVGVAGTTLPLGKHSGRHALRARLARVGIVLAEAQLEAASAEIKALAEDGQTVDDAILTEMGQRLARAARTASAPGTTRGTRPRTLLEKIWDSHEVKPATPDTPAVLYVDLHLVHEVTSAQAFAALRERGLRVRSPERTIATMDHATSTADPGPAQMPGDRGRRMLALCGDEARAQLDTLRRNTEDEGIPLLALGDPRRGIVHVIGPELGLTQPGMTIVCGDSHTSTHGAFGALAFGIGTTQVSHVLATQSLLQVRPPVMRVDIRGTLTPGVTAKDLALALAARIGVGGGTGHVLEYTGPAVRALGMEGRMTLCNMAIELGARAGMVAPDETTFAYLKGRPGAPSGAAWDEALARWKTLASDAGARYDRETTIDADAVEPMVTYGTNPGMAVPVSGRIPDPAGREFPGDPAVRDATARALDYMGLGAGNPIAGTPVDVVFVGSCTNARLSDLRDVARVLRGRKVAEGVRMLVVPGSDSVKQQAELEGLHEVIRHAGAEWRESGCSMCIAMNDDRLAPGQRAVSTSNRNFEGRQGRGGRTLLASPATAAAAAVAGAIVDPRPYLTEQTA